MNKPWFQLVASLIAMVMIANLQYAWTLFVVPLQQGNGWALPDVQWAFTLFILFQTWVQPLDGWLIDRLGPRLFITIAGVLSGVGWAALGSASTVPQLYLFYALAGVGAALVYSGSIGSALKWFRDRRGLATGVIAAGFGSGTALFIPIIRYLIDTYGYSTAFRWTGVFQGLVIVAVAQVLRHPKATASIAPASAKKSSRSRRNEENFTTWEMLRTPHFYVLYVMFVAMSTGGLLATAQPGPLARTWGLPIAALTLATTINPLANGGSRIFWGWVSDRTGRESAMVVAFLLQAVCLVSVMTLGRTSSFWFVVTLALTFFTWGEIYALFPATVGDWFGARSATSNYSFLYSGKGVASILGGGVAAQMFQRYGSWGPAIYGSAALALFAAVLALVLRGVPLPKKAVVESVVATPDTL